MNTALTTPGSVGPLNQIIDTDMATEMWARYCFNRDNGHTKFVEKADRCEAYFRGDQWDEMDLMKLRAVRRPAMTINKIISTISNVMGEQIFQRSETSFRPRSDTTDAQAQLMTDVYKQVSDMNQLAWKRSDCFADGIITSRGFLDVRMNFDDTTLGRIVIDNLNSKNVIVGADAEQYDPDTWDEVFITKWLTADDIAILYGEDKADQLRGRTASYFPYGYDSIDWARDRFGDRFSSFYTGVFDGGNTMRNIRMVERQYKKLSKQKTFVFPQTGDTRPIPDNFDRNKIAFYVEKFGLKVIHKLTRRIKWDVMADGVELHSEWSPYKHFTVIPYFPYFRYGKTIGLVENLVNPQDILNKVSSQELHVVNTTANSGYKVKSGALVGMTVEELEARGAETGIVIEVNGDPEKDVVRITPNQVPTGLDRVSTKAEESIKTISGISDSQQGMDRADVAAKAIDAKKKAGQTNLVKPMDNLARTDYFLARNIVDLVQEFMTAPQVITIVSDDNTGQTKQFGINQPDPADVDRMLNDMTLGEYGIIITSVPSREAIDDDQFDQLMSMKQEGVQVPDEALIAVSRIRDKPALNKMMQAGQSSPQAQLQQAAGQASVEKTKAETARDHADAQLKLAKAKTESEPEAAQQQDPAKAMAAHASMITAHAGAHRQAIETDHNIEMQHRQADQKDRELDIKEQAEANKVQQAKEAAVQQAAQAALQPQPAPAA